MKRNLFITCALGLLSGAFSAQASNDPWDYYRVGGNYSSSYFQKYDSTFGVSLTGMHAWATEEGEPNQFGGLLDIHSNIDSGSVYHTFSLTSGYMGGEHTYMGYKCFREIVPVLAGYTLNLPLSEKASFYLGGKAGIAWSYAEIRGSSSYAVSTPGGVATGSSSGVLASDSGTAFTYALSVGFSFAVGEKTDFKIGYEMFSFKGLDPFHAVEIGFSWNF